MRVIELAKNLKVEPEALLQLLREMGIHVTGQGAQVADADVSRVLARVERERRAGKRDASDAIQAAIEEASAGPKRRRRRKAEEPEEPVPVEDTAAAPEAEAPVEASTPGPEPEPVAVVEPARAPQEPEPAEVSEPTPVAEERGAPVAEPEQPRPRPFDMDRLGSPLEKPQPARRGAAEGPARILVRRPTQQQPQAPAPALFGPTPTPAASAGPGGQVRIQAEGYTADGRRKVKEKKKGKKRQRVDQDAVQENIQRVMAELKGGGKKRRRKGVLSREDQEAAELEAEEERERERKTVRVNEFLTVSELAGLIDVPANQIIGSAFKNLGLMVTINQRLDFDQIELLLDEFGFTAMREKEYASPEAQQEVEEVERAEDLEPRPPVVTVMGHVDHGKTLLLDRIRKTNVVAGEAGGITQHIGAYHVQLEDGRSLTFLDTPGHAAFTAMRARGAEVTDIVILMVAADDSVMPQTVEAISHAKNAGVPMVVAINKVDLPAANPMRVKQELLKHDIQVEEFGGNVLSSEVSAKTGKGIDDLLEKVLLQAEMLDLKENPHREAQGTVIEAQLDIGKGPVITVLVQKGTLRVGDSFLSGLYDGRVRALLDERGKSVAQAGPGIPVQVLGAAGVPQAGDTFQAMDPVKAAEVATTRQRLEREKQLRVKERGLKLGDFSQLVGEGVTDKLLLVIKGDVDGSVQAVSDALEQLSTSEVRVEVIHRAVGAINESDVLLAETAGAVIIGFRVRPDSKARQLAERDGVEIWFYDVIYNAVNDVRAALEGMLAPEKKEVIVGSAEVREVFKISRVGTIAGCYVTEGLVDRKSKARVIRDGIVVYDGEIGSLKRFKDDAREVREGFECGIGIANFNDVKVGDLIECYKVEEIARTLAGAGAGR
jgi:translation initiation factor IF-2